MKVVCIHCGGEFTIRPEDLGGSGFCPHCRGTIELPKGTRGDARVDTPEERPHPVNWLDNTLSGLLSLILHMTLFVAIALLQPRGGQSKLPEGNVPKL